jgi:hypothetical protein
MPILVETMITMDSAPKLIQDHNFNGEIDLLSMDIDG